MQGNIELAQSQRRRRATVRTGLMAGALAASMVGLGFASVPLYRIFCQVTGFGGTTMQVDAAQAASIKPTADLITIRFDANVRGIPWEFGPEQVTDKVAIGARDLAIYVARNEGGQSTLGTASYNVTPEQAGKYFNKIQCFCFTEQALKPGQMVRMPVLYYIDPAIRDDPDTKNIKEITLSYTFFPVDQTE
jgi:cytochrome c oxidase assembly protein subunit 11